ncbi:MAG: hypothetical protein ACOY2B_13475 [Pseudomonadota bacterium]
MRKIWLTDGRLSVSILPDCGGALAALRWHTPDGLTHEMLAPASAGDIAGKVAASMACLPAAVYAGAMTGCGTLGEWTVQDASNIRATLTQHQEGVNPQHPSHAPHWSCQALQRFELTPGGLHVRFTITNIGVAPVPARTGLRLRLNRRANFQLRGDLEPVMAAADGSPSPPPGSFKTGFQFLDQDVQITLRHLKNDFFCTWPEDRLMLKFTLDHGLNYIAVDYRAAQKEVWLTPLSHAPAGETGHPAFQILQQGDSLEAVLFLSPGPMAG